MVFYLSHSLLVAPLPTLPKLQEFVRLAGAMAAGESTDPGPPPPNQLAAQWSLVPPVVADGAPAGKQFGDVVQDVGQGPYAPGNTVSAVFVAGCPRNNIRQEGTFLTGGWQGGSEGRQQYAGGQAPQGRPAWQPAAGWQQIAPQHQQALTCRQTRQGLHEGFRRNHHPPLY